MWVSVLDVKDENDGNVYESNCIHYIVCFQCFTNRLCTFIPELIGIEAKWCECLYLMCKLQIMKTEESDCICYFICFQCFTNVVCTSWSDLIMREVKWCECLYLMCKLQIMKNRREWLYVLLCLFLMLHQSIVRLHRRFDSYRDGVIWVSVLAMNVENTKNSECIYYFVCF